MGGELSNKSCNKQCRKFGDGRENGREDLGREILGTVLPVSGIHGVKRKLDRE